MKLVFKSAPYLVLLTAMLCGCTNREILHGSSSDRPPTLKLGKKLAVSSKVKTDASDKEDLAQTETSSAEVDKAGKEVVATTTDEVVEPAKEGKMRIWFARESKGSVQPYAVEREIDKKEPLRSAVNQLLQGPTEAESKTGIKSEVPVGTVLISLKKKDNVVELNLSRRFGAGGVDSIETRLQQLQLTIKEAAGHDKVFLDVEGKRLTSAGDGLEVKQPLN
ncbi:MAG: GerMN domain-containing protein [Candidatus Obscuribacterales bacterium]|nr:GerMN domain-containing protein [Candidatus Obscuribacterales bacterium]